MAKREYEYVLLWIPCGTIECIDGAGYFTADGMEMGAAAIIRRAHKRKVHNSKLAFQRLICWSFHKYTDRMHWTNFVWTLEKLFNDVLLGVLNPKYPACTPFPSTDLIKAETQLAETTQQPTYSTSAQNYLKQFYDQIWSDKRKEPQLAKTTQQPTSALNKISSSMF